MLKIDIVDCLQTPNTKYHENSPYDLCALYSNLQLFILFYFIKKQFYMNAHFGVNYSFVYLFLVWCLMFVFLCVCSMFAFLLKQCALS